MSGKPERKFRPALPDGAYFPLFVSLRDKNVLVAGGGHVAAGKVTQLLEFGAVVTVVSPCLGAELRRCSDNGRISFIGRSYMSTDVTGVALVVAATGNRDVNRQIHEDAAALSVPVNVVDDPELCTFYFPSIVRRGPFVIGISTSGMYPLLAKSCRKRLETEFPSGYGIVTETLGTIRQRLLDSGTDRTRLREMLGRLLDYGLSLVSVSENECSDAEIETQLYRLFAELSETVLPEGKCE